MLHTHHREDNGPYVFDSRKIDSDRPHFVLFLHVVLKRTVGEKKRDEGISKLKQKLHRMKSN